MWIKLCIYIYVSANYRLNCWQGIIMYLYVTYRQLLSQLLTIKLVLPSLSDGCLRCFDTMKIGTICLLVYGLARHTSFPHDQILMLAVGFRPTKTPGKSCLYLHVGLQVVISVAVMRLPTWLKFLIDYEVYHYHICLFSTSQERFVLNKFRLRGSNKKKLTKSDV